MGVPSLQEDNQIHASSSPKQPTSELKHEANYKDIRCVSLDQKNDTSENIGTETAETTMVLTSVSYSVEISSAETNTNSEKSGQPVDDVSENQGLGQLEAIHEDAAINTNPEEPAPPPDDVSNSQVLELWQPIQENTNSSPKESGPPPDDVSKIDGCGQLEPMQEDATCPTSQAEHEEKGEDGPTNSDPKESGPQLNDVLKNLGLGQSESMEEDGTKRTTNSNPEELRGPPNDVSKNGGLEELVSMEEDATCNSSQLGYDEKGEDEARNSSCKVSVPPLEDVSKNQGVVEKGEDTARNSNPEELGPPPADLSNSIGQLDAMQEDKKIEDVATDSNPEGSGPPPDDVSKYQDPTDEALHGEKGEDLATNSNTEELGSPNGEKGTNVKPRKGKNKSTPFGSPRVLRSRSEEKSKAPESSTNVTEDLANKENKRKNRKKKKQMKNVEKSNEFSRIRKHLRYLLTRMNYEQNLIDAYSGEGWKGQSLEKIKPEKELQRAKSEIFRCKLKIRDLFQRLHMSCAEGRLPEDLFDSEGEIDSEDIFCAKCGSKELPANNDIILCDGACERGFHQFCLDPPLLNEDIPPDDEGWLCPGCDCKVDCIELLNDSQGTNLSITDSWEEVFPEAAAAASGTNMADISGLPSDDSEDDDYDPEGPQLEKEMLDTESSSNESDFSSASDDLGSLPITDPYAGLPSEDSEDDDYNPNSRDPDEKDKQESSSSDSDFTSDSEYFSAGSDDNGERPEVGGTRRQILSDELLSLLEPGPVGGDSAPLSEKRHVERLDYKRLHDEAYGNASSDSSDEDYTDAPARKRRKTNNGKVATVLPKRDAPNKDSKQNLKESEQTPKRRTGKKLDDEATSDSPAKLSKGSSGPDSSSKSTNRNLGEAATQRLLESFKDNKYPDRVAKENLAKELSLAVKQVSKWFENARWSFNHSSRMDSKLAESASRNGTRDHVEKSAAARNSRPTKSRQSNVKSDNKNTEAVSSTVEMTHKQKADDNTPKAQEVRRSGRVRSKSTNSGS